jgi:hypothetical protein
MTGIFISYRRQDSGGHAGRIGDRLRQMFGELVFQDVDNIADGEVFETVIDRALSTCDVALVVIGQNWVTSADSRGRRRLDDPHDWVRTEIRMMLSRGIRVIPLLVGGAAMPSREELPDELHPLLKRQARELRDTSWDSDMDGLVKRLETILAGEKQPLPPSAHRPASGFRRLFFASAALAVLLTVGAAVWWLGPDRSQPQTAAPAAPAAPSTAAGTAAQARRPASSPQPAFVAIPPPGQVRLGATRYDLLGIRLEPYDGQHDSLVFTVRMHNLGPYAANFWSSSFRLLVDGALASPTNSLNALLEPRAALDGEVAFTVPKSAREVELQIGTREKNAKIPVDTSARVEPSVRADSIVLPRKTRLPLQLSAGASVRIGEVHYEVLSAEVDRHNFEVDTIEVRVAVRATNNGRYDAAFSDGVMRLLVDGIPRASERTTRFYERLEPGASMERNLTFVEPRPAQTLALGFVDRSPERFTLVPLLPKPGA